ncbi:MAG: 23S rRNA (pseudouridine(1915)-N(3))-methyltransferase RlmH [Waddliaceae bacterium]|nr:23S rRNA (pseudouridine(1915)-N(3))-methyltransferase RlmH [Waddliaceae bacterium]
MLKVKIITPGKTKEHWLKDALDEYCKRLSGAIAIEFVYPRDDAHLVSLVDKEKLCLALDPFGDVVTSEGFCKILYKAFEEGGSRVSFVIGGPEGLPDVVRKRCNMLRLSSMTFTHQMTRLILLEQIYRAAEIYRGSSYHK